MIEQRLFAGEYMRLLWIPVVILLPDTGIATELFQKHFGRNPERAEIEALHQ